MTKSCLTRRFVLGATLAAAAGALAACSRLFPPDTHGLYSAKAFTTGQSEANSAPRIIDCLTDVLVKVSGDPTVATDPRLPAFAGQARGFITGLTYRDYMEGLPIGDEQGTRDRPYFLTASFAPDKVDAALSSLGRTPWNVRRPIIAVILGVRNHGREYMLTTDGEWGVDQRSALADAAWQMGLTETLPGGASPAVADLTFDKIAASAPASMAAFATSAGGDLPLAGTLAWGDGALGWRARWRLDHEGKTHDWAAHDVSFDEAFRVAMRGTLQILSGHGTPG